MHTDICSTDVSAAHGIGMKLRWPLPQTIGLYLPAAAGVVCLSYAVECSASVRAMGRVGLAAVVRDPVRVAVSGRREEIAGQ